MKSLRTAVSVMAMVALLAGGTFLILSQAINRVADRHSSDLVRANAGLLRPAFDAATTSDDDRSGGPLSVEAERHMLQRDFLLAFFELLFMTGCSCGVPAALVFWRGWQKRRSDERIDFLVHHDAATSLLNRVSFTQALDGRIAEAARDGDFLAIHFVDLDRFKAINDTLGHAGGDQLIASAARRLREVAGPRDLVGRFGVDEFVFAQGGTSSLEAALAKSHEIMGRIGRPFRVGETDVAVTASIGLAVAPTDGTDAATLMHAADTAMSRAKADGRDQIRVYEPEMDVTLQSRLTVEEAIRRALDTDGFVLNFQPVYKARTEKLIGFEVLLRLPVPGRDPIPPAIFIPIAEEMGIITKIGSWVIEQACIAAATWPDDLFVAVNLSPKQLDQDEIFGVVLNALARSGLPAERLELEITESVLLRETEGVIDQLGRLKALGISIAMDDFGTGYSSLSNLWRFPFDKLKIDRSFMSHLTGADDNLLNILKTIVSLGRTLNLQVTAEGIETQAQADLLRSLDCDQLQGYHYGRPMPEQDLLQLLDAGVGNGDRPSPTTPARRPYTFKGQFGGHAAVADERLMLS